MEFLHTALSWLQEHTVGIGVFFAVVSLFYVVKRLVLFRLDRLSARTKNDYDDLVIDVIQTVRLSFAVIASLMIALSVSGFNFESSKAVVVLFAASVTYQVARAVGVVFTFVIKKVRGEDERVANVQGLKTVIDICIWAIGAVFIISILGYNVNSIIAGLGIGGVAVALAVQNVLGDVFSSFSIFFDRPFEVDDYIQIGEHEGTVERIGLKTTRVRSPRGEEIIFSNRLLTDSIIQNLGRLEKRRVKVMLGVEYETPNSKLESIPAGIQEVVKSVQQVEFERVYFKEFASSSLDHEFTYYVTYADFDEFVAARHEINLRVKAWFEQQGIGLAYPTQRVYKSEI